MIVILVHWQISPEREQDFLHYWQTSGTVRDRTGLVGEFLSRVVPQDEIRTPWITWSLPQDEAAADAVHYVNVGVWSGEGPFLEQIAPDFGDDRPIQDFELRRRRRLLLTPEAWRIGAVPLAQADSPGVV
ncbi:MAG TPA: hypothetical protein VMI52_10105 [Acetobacteraceae bacterium]|nr:hypothetical protein [Acetobacteraceae bacterium]